MIDEAVRLVRARLMAKFGTPRYYGRQFHSVIDFLQDQGSWVSKYTSRINGQHTRMIRAEFRRIEAE